MEGASTKGANYLHEVTNLPLHIQPFRSRWHSASSTIGSLRTGRWPQGSSSSAPPLGAIPFSLVLQMLLERFDWTMSTALLSVVLCAFMTAEDGFVRTNIRQAKFFGSCYERTFLLKYWCDSL